MEPLHRGTNTKKQSSSRLELMQETAGSVDYAHGPGVSKRYMQYKEAQFKKKTKPRWSRFYKSQNNELVAIKTYYLQKKSVTKSKKKDIQSWFL